MTRHVVTVVAVLFVLITVPTIGAQVAGPPPLDLFFAAASPDNRVAKAALDSLAGQWRDSYTPMIIDLARLLRPAPRPTAPSGSADLGAQPTDGPDDGDDSGARSLGAELAAVPGTGVTHESMIRSRLIGFLVDTAGRTRRLAEDALTLADGSATLPRFAAQRAFWFGWYAQYPETVLLGDRRARAPTVALLGFRPAVAHPLGQPRLEFAPGLLFDRSRARRRGDNLELPLEGAAVATHRQVQPHREAPRERRLRQLASCDQCRHFFTGHHVSDPSPFPEGTHASARALDAATPQCA